MPKETSSEKLIAAINKSNKLQGRRPTFIRGIYSGLGASIGATLVLALLFWILSQLQYVPFIGTVVKPAAEVLKNTVPDRLH